MIKLLLLLKKIHYVLLFAILEAIAISFYVDSSPYQKAALVGAANTLTGAVNQRIEGVNSYFTLGRENEVLQMENAALRARVQAMETMLERAPEYDSTHILSLPQYRVARVVRNTYTRANNYIVLNKGIQDSIEPNMALMNSEGILGYVLFCSDHYSVALSVLNVADFRTSGRLAGTDFTGSISWDAGNYRYVNFEEVPKYADIQIGDTVVTTSYSNIFPDNMPIGRVVSFQIYNGTFYNARVELFADMSRLRYVYATKLTEQEERQQIESMIPKSEN